MMDTDHSPGDIEHCSNAASDRLHADLRCLRCGYDLSNADERGKCRKCGTPYVRARLVLAVTTRWRLAPWVAVWAGLAFVVYLGCVVQIALKADLKTLALAWWVPFPVATPFVVLTLASAYLSMFRFKKPTQFFCLLGGTAGAIIAVGWMPFVPTADPNKEALWAVAYWIWPPIFSPLVLFGMLVGAPTGVLVGRTAGATATRATTEN